MSLICWMYFIRCKNNNNVVLVYPVIVLSARCRLHQSSSLCIHVCFWGFWLAGFLFSPKCCTILLHDFRLCKKNALLSWNQCINWDTAYIDRHPGTNTHAGKLFPSVSRRVKSFHYGFVQWISFSYLQAKRGSRLLTKPQYSIKQKEEKENSEALEVLTLSQWSSAGQSETVHELVKRENLKQ